MLFQGLSSFPFSIYKTCWCEELYAYSHWCSCCEQLVSAKKADTCIHIQAHRNLHTYRHLYTSKWVLYSGPTLPHIYYSIFCSRVLTAFQLTATQHNFSTQAAQSKDMTNTWLTLEPWPRSLYTAMCTVHIYYAELEYILQFTQLFIGKQNWNIIV